MSEKRQAEQPDILEIKELREPSAAYIRNIEIPTFFGEPMLNGSFAQLDAVQLSPDVPTLYYQHPHGAILCGDAITWLRSLKSETPILTLMI